MGGREPCPYLKLVHSHGEGRDRWHCSADQILKNCFRKKVPFSCSHAGNLFISCGVHVGRVTRIKVILFQFNNTLHAPLRRTRTRTRGSGPLFSAGEEGIPGAFFISDGAKICRCWDGSSTLINTTAHHHLEQNRSRLKMFLHGRYALLDVCVWHTPISFLLCRYAADHQRSWK